MKNLKLKLTMVMLCAFAKAGYAQQVDGNSVVYTSQEGKMRIEMCSDNMFRVTKVATQQMPENEKWMVVNYDFPQVAFSVDGKQIKTSKLQVNIQEMPWRIQVADASGRVFYDELASGCKDSVYNVVKMNPDEHFFGFGERMDRIDQRGQRVHLNVELGSGRKPAVGGKDILRANYCPVPLMLSNKGYAVFFHTAVPNDWDMGWTCNDKYSFSAPGGDNDYYVIYGEQLETDS